MQWQITAFSWIPWVLCQLFYDSGLVVLRQGSPAAVSIKLAANGHTEQKKKIQLKAEQAHGGLAMMLPPAPLAAEELA